MLPRGEASRTYGPEAHATRGEARGTYGPEAHATRGGEGATMGFVPREHMREPIRS